IYVVCDIGADNASNYHAILGSSNGITSISLHSTDISDGAPFHSINLIANGGSLQTTPAEVAPLQPCIFAVTFDGSNTVNSKIYINGLEVRAYDSQDTGYGSF